MELHEISDSDLIEVGVTEDDLNERLRKGIEKKILSGDQWFRTPNNWYDMASYINPYKGVYDELPILFEHADRFRLYLKESLKVFWGVGVADSESIPVRWDLESDKYAEINAIDVINYFLEGFMLSLKNLAKIFPSSTIMFVGNNTLFETIKKEQIKPTNSQFDKATHLCFGNTIGNFEQDEIFQIFDRNIDQGDLLLLGYQLNTDPQKILSLYENNARIDRFVLDPIDRGSRIPAIVRIVRRIKGIKLIWRYNYETDYVEAWLGDILVFRSKKYDTSKLVDFARQYDFDLVKTYSYGDCGVSLFRKL